MKQQNFSLFNRIESFKFAFNGLKILVREEHNSRVHLLVGICVLILGALLGISTLEWIAIVFAIGFVIALETINSVIENMADFISPEKHGKIKKMKDLSAAAVLISVITAVVIGLIVFLPKLVQFIK